jgi:hypothetical protein
MIMQILPGSSDDGALINASRRFCNMLSGEATFRDGHRSGPPLRIGGIDQLNAPPRDLTGTEILSDRLTLRAFVPADARDIFPEATLEISRYMTWEPAVSLEAFSTIWPEWLQKTRAGVELSLVVRRRLTDEFLRCCGQVMPAVLFGGHPVGVVAP